MTRRGGEIDKSSKIFCAADELLTYAVATGLIPRQLPNERLLLWPVNSPIRPPIAVLRGSELPAAEETCIARRKVHTRGQQCGDIGSDRRSP